MVHAGCVFVAGFHPCRTWMSGSFESVRWSACVHRLDFGLYSHLKGFWGNGVRTHVNSKGKIPSTGKTLCRRGWNPWCCIKQDSESNTLPTSYSGPREQGYGSSLIVVNCTSHLKTCALVASLPSTWNCGVSARTGWPSISTLWVGETASVICSLCFSDTACGVVCWDLSLRYTLHVAGA